MKKNKKSKATHIDNKRKKTPSSFDKGKGKAMRDIEKEKMCAHINATKTLRKDVRINIRLSSADILSIKQIAALEGLPYQTLISSILHKYATGHLGIKI